LEEVGEAPPRLPIQRGEVAPDFLGKTVDGQPIRLSDFRGRFVVLILEETVSTACSSCVSASPSRGSRTAAACDVLRDLRDDVVILSVHPGSRSPEGEDTSRGASEPIAILSDEAFAVYRRETGMFLLDREMRIVEMDEAWSTVRCGRPMGKLDVLNEFELRQSLERLLAEETQDAG
jgi:hypothetical protein